MRTPNLHARYETIAARLTEQATLPDVIITTDVVPDLMDKLDVSKRYAHFREERFRDIDDLDEVTYYLSNAETTQC